MILSLPRNLWLLVYLWIIYDEVSMFMIDLVNMRKKASYWIYKKKDCTEYQVFEYFVFQFLALAILIFGFHYFGWLCFLIYYHSTSLCQLKYKHRFMSVIYFDWIPICFIKCKNRSFGKHNFCCNFSIASFNIENSYRMWRTWKAV